LESSAVTSWGGRSRRRWRGWRRTLWIVSPYTPSNSCPTYLIILQLNTIPCRRRRSRRWWRGWRRTLRTISLCTFFTIVSNLPYHPPIQRYTAQAKAVLATEVGKEKDSGYNQSRHALNSHAQLTVKLQMCMFRICMSFLSL
jgi:hypothetical protein